MKDVLKDVFLPWFNAYRYLTQSIERLKRVLKLCSINCTVGYVILFVIRDKKNCCFLTSAVTPQRKWRIVEHQNIKSSVFVLFQEEGIDFVYDEKSWQLTEDYNYMDRWILSFTQSLIKFVRQEMAGQYVHVYIYRQTHRCCAKAYTCTLFM